MKTLTDAEFVLLDWYYDDDIIDTQTAEWRDIEKMNERYHTLVGMGLDPFSDELRSAWRARRQT